MKKTKTFCVIRKDLLTEELGVPVGNEFYYSAKPIQYRWKDNGDDEFQVLFNGKWVEAYSIDFDFPEIKEVKKFAVLKTEIIKKGHRVEVGPFAINNCQEFEYKGEGKDFKLKIKGRYYSADPKHFDFIEGTDTQEQRSPELLEEITASCIIMQGLVRNLMDGVYKTPSELLPRLEAIIASQKEAIKKTKV